MKHFKDNIQRIPPELDVNSEEYEKWKEEYLDDCGLYSRHIIAELLEIEECERMDSFYNEDNFNEGTIKHFQD